MAITIDLSGQVDGTFTIEDDGTPGNGTSVVRRPDGTIFVTFAHPADALTIVSRAGQSVVVNITDSLTTASLTVGSLTVPGSNPDNIQIGNVITSGIVTLAARNSISEFGRDGATDIFAGRLFLDAGTGIGRFNAIETQVSVLEAESVTGGINLSNIGNLTIGGDALGTPALRGLLTNTSGDITLINQGAITLSERDGIESVRSAGNLTLSAIGASADISSNVNEDAILAVGNIFLSASRDIVFGRGGANFDNDVRAGANVVVNAGRDFIIDGFSDMQSDDLFLGTDGGITIRAGRDILIDDAFGTDAGIGVTPFASAGAISLTTGVGGTLLVHANFSAAIQGRNGGVTIRADRIQIESDSGISVTGTGGLTLTTASGGRGITLGVASDSLTTLDLSDAELDRIFTQNVTIGSSEAGSISVDGAITHANNNLILRSGGDILVNADITTPGSLTLASAETVFQDAASTLTTGALTVTVDTPDFDPSGGLAELLGSVSATTVLINGNADDDTLFRIAGANATMSGGDGDDTYVVGSGDIVVEAAGEGFDRVNAVADYALSSTGEVEVLAAQDPAAVTALNLTGNDFDQEISGNAGANTILGLGGFDTLRGFGGADTLDGGDGADELEGGLGNDLLLGGGGNDGLDGGDGDDELQGGAGINAAVYLSASAGVTVNLGLAGAQNTIGAGVDTLVDIRNLIGSGFGDNLSGAAGANTLEGRGGGDVLDGGAGADMMIGGAGDDSYAFDGSDTLIELAGEGTDTVTSIVSFTLPSHFENLILAGAATAGTGNAADNVITGNAAANTLNGGAGADTMNGGGGNDAYFVDDPGDNPVEISASGGTDTVRSSVSLTLGANLERLVLLGSAAIDGTGNALNNVLTGNSAANVLNGAAGADTMSGGAGDDFYLIDNVGDKAIENSAADGLDTVSSSVTFSLGAHVENLILTGAAAISGTGNSLANTITGNVAANVINGGGGADTMAGGGGNDIYRVDNVGDQVNEAAGDGIDLVKSTVTFTLAPDVEKLTLLGSAAIDGTGNALANVIAGNTAANTLDGGTGADKLSGGDGNDTYIVDDASDQVTESSSGGGTDLVRSSVTFALGNNVENLTLTGSAAINGTGNGLGNALTGNSAANILDGRQGNDTLSGGGGGDTLNGGVGSDTLEGGNGTDQFLFDKPLGATNIDLILDFAGGTDKIVLQNSVFTGLAAGALAPNALRIGTAAGDADDRIIYDPATGNLFFDSDGTGAAAQILFATLDNQPASIAAGDFLVI